MKRKEKRRTGYALPAGSPHREVVLAREELLVLLSVAVAEVRAVNIAIMQAHALFREAYRPKAFEKKKIRVKVSQPCTGSATPDSELFFRQTHFAYSWKPDSVRMNGSESAVMITFSGSPK